MKAPHLLSSVLLASCLNACSLGAETPPPLPSPYSELPARTSTLSGLIIDPEAFFFLLANWPSAPDPSLNAPPALYDGIPYLFFSSVPEAAIYVVDEQNTPLGTAQSTPTGSWQVASVPSSDQSLYHARAEPPARGVTLGEGYLDPEGPPPPVTAPPATYYPTTTLRPIATTATLCQYQLATLVGNGGALQALAAARSTPGRPVTVADLLNSAKTGGVGLFWVYSPSFDSDIWMAPTDGIAAKASRGQVYAIDWAPPGSGIPGQSSMGYFATAVTGAVTSSLSYYAVVLPAGDSGAPVTVTFTDKVTTPEGEDPGPFGPRPWFIPPSVETLRPGVSFGRVFAFPAGPPPEDPLADPVLFPPNNSQCYPEPPSE